MHIGKQLEAPDGFLQLSQSVSYHFLRSDAATDKALLIHFTKSTPSKAMLINMNLAQFEAGLVSKAIVPSEKQYRLPPWLRKLELADIILPLVDLSRGSTKKSLSDRVLSRLNVIAPLLDNLDDVLSSENPDEYINRHARTCNPRQHQSRVRLWFYTYVLFGQNQWSLLPPFCSIGGWSREEKGEGPKYGRPSLTSGKRHGFRVTPSLAEEIRNAYVRLCGLGRHLRPIYAEAMMKYFECDLVREGKYIKYMPKNDKPYPTFKQFEYWIIKEFGRQTIQKTVYGEARFRSKMSASKGKFSELLRNLMESIEVDGFYRDDRPRGVVEGSTLPALCVVRAVCGISGTLVGVGFSLGAETGAAYRCMLFSMAITKSRFGELFGMPISDNEWPCVGLPSKIIFDRGPGSSLNLVQSFQKHFPIRELTPSWSGQSKPSVESSHPGSTNIEGAPQYIQSDLNPVDMAREEIMRVIKDNHTSDAWARMTPAMIAAEIPQSPAGIWDYMDERARTDAHPMAFDDAVRNFLTPVKFTVRHDGVYLRDQRYDSSLFRKSGILERIAIDQRTKIDGYILDLCVRYIWIEIDQKIIELKAVLPHLEDEAQLFMSRDELEQIVEIGRVTKSHYREHQLAASTSIMSRYMEATGKRWGHGTRKIGRPKAKTPTARQEQKDLKTLFSSLKETR